MSQLDRSALAAFTVGSARALWITIQFLSQSMSLERIKLVGYFTTDTTEAWSTFGGEEDVFVCPPRQDGCLLGLNISSSMVAFVRLRSRGLKVCLM